MQYWKIRELMREIIEDTDEEQVVWLVRWIDHDKVKQAMSSFVDFKVCGSDEMKPIMLKNLP